MGASEACTLWVDVDARWGVYHGPGFLWDVLGLFVGVVWCGGHCHASRHLSVSWPLYLRKRYRDDGIDGRQNSAPLLVSVRPSLELSSPWSL